MTSVRRKSRSLQIAFDLGNFDNLKTDVTFRAGQVGGNDQDVRSLKHPRNCDCYDRFALHECTPELGMVARRHRHPSQHGTWRTKKPDGDEDSRGHRRATSLGNHHGDRFLCSSKVARLGRALDAREAEWPEAVSAIRLLALTSRRRDEAINLPDGKTGPHAVPIGEAARALGCARRAQPPLSCTPGRAAIQRLRIGKFLIAAAIAAAIGLQGCGGGSSSIRSAPLPAPPATPVIGDTGEDPTDDTGEDPTDDTGEDPTDDTGEDPTDDTGEDPTDDTGEDPTDDTGEDPTDDTGEDPTDDTGEDPTDDTGEDPTDDTGEDPTDDTGEDPTDDTGEDPTDDTGEDPTDDTGEDPTDDTGEDPTDDTGEDPTDDTGEDPTDDTGEDPTDDTGEDPTDNGICSRTEQVRTAILALIVGIDTCGTVTDAHLGAITGWLDLSQAGISSLQADDFSGLAGLTKLNLNNNQLETLPAGVFVGLNLRFLGLETNRLRTLPAGVFDGLTSLREVRLLINRLETLPKEVFADLNSLRILDLEFNRLHTLPMGIFAGLDLTFLGLEANRLRTLPAGMFEGLDVETLDLSHNETRSLSAEVFSGLSSLRDLDLGYNQLDTLPAGVFDGLTSLRSLWLEENPGADFTFTMTVERIPGTNKVVVTVAQGAPFAMTTTIDVTGGILPAGVSSVTVPVGRTTSDEIAVTPLDGTTITLGAVPPVPSTPIPGTGGVLRFTGITTAVEGEPVQFNGPAALSVADARVEEAEDAVLAFAVTLDRAASGTLTVDYATSDGTATAGEDYTATSGTLSFQAGDTEKTITVAVLDDDHNEGEETVTLTLSNASGARTADASATGTIENRDPLPRAFMARFGRTAAVHVVEQVQERIEARRETGFRGQVAGLQVRPGMESDMAVGFLNRLAPSLGANRVGAGVHHPMSVSPAANPGAFGTPGLAGGAPMGTADGLLGGANPMGSMPGTDGGLNQRGDFGMGLGGGNLLTGSAFVMNHETRRGGILSFWSLGAQSQFAGRDGQLSLDGRVRTTMFGADYAKGPLVTGLSLSHSRGLGEYTGVDVGEVTSSVTGLYPWLGYKVTDRITLWGVTGYGKGALRLTPGAGTALRSGLSMAMTAGGMRGELADSVVGGFGLAFKADALWVGTGIEGVDGPQGRLAATSAAVTRFRTGLEASRGYSFQRGLSLQPSLEVGVRRDGGDAENGVGVDVGGGLIVSDALTGLSADVRVRMLLVHQDRGFRDRGMSVSFSYNPTPSTPLGFTAKLTPSWGGQATSGARALWGRETMAGMAQGGMASGNSLEAELGYGLPVGSRLVGTPRFGIGTSEYGRDYRLGYGLTVLQRGSMNFELGIEGTRRESSRQGVTDHGALARLTASW